MIVSGSFLHQANFPIHPIGTDGDEGEREREGGG